MVFAHVRTAAPRAEGHENIRPEYQRKSREQGTEYLCD